MYELNTINATELNQYDKLKELNTDYSVSTQIQLPSMQTRHPWIHHLSIPEIEFKLK